MLCIYIVSVDLYRACVCALCSCMYIVLVYVYCVCRAPWLLGFLLFPVCLCYRGLFCSQVRFGVHWIVCCCSRGFVSVGISEGVSVFQKCLRDNVCAFILCLCIYSVLCMYIVFVCLRCVCVYCVCVFILYTNTVPQTPLENRHTLRHANRNTTSRTQKQSTAHRNAPANNLCTHRKNRQTRNAGNNGALQTQYKHSNTISIH